VIKAVSQWQALWFSAAYAALRETSLGVAELQRGSLLLQSLVKAGDDGAKRKIAPEYMRIFTLP
jgi:hypothetical protein